jgi:ribosomal protein S21
MNPSTRLKKMQRQDIFREMKLRRNHEPPEKRSVSR